MKKKASRPGKKTRLFFDLSPKRGQFSRRPRFGNVTQPDFNFKDILSK
jgi:hypothetical protein